jgi:catechol 2,3-dioxygenase-like lactoylglutathione lyase family enzyme
MSTTAMGLDLAAEPQDVNTIDMKLEVITLPVTDVDRAKAFYQRLGWRLDADFTVGDAVRGVQMTPPRSGTSIQFGKGLTTVAPGSAQRMMLAVEDIAAARDDLLARGIEVGEVVHQGAAGFEPGPDPQRGSYQSYASFSDPDGNGWLLQEVHDRRPGRLW